MDNNQQPYASWQTRGKWSSELPSCSRSGYGTIPDDGIAPYHVDATATDDEGFRGTMSFPMRRAGLTLADDGEKAERIGGWSVCSVYLWASLWSHVPGADVRMEPGYMPLGLDRIEALLCRYTWLIFREYTKTITGFEAAELAGIRHDAEVRRAKEKAEREALYTIPAIDDQVTWKGRRYNPPTMGELQEWVTDSVCETPDGDHVEPDHPDSWLSILGMI